jgi:hypothetical protein
MPLVIETVSVAVAMVSEMFRVLFDTLVTVSAAIPAVSATVLLKVSDALIAVSEATEIVSVAVRTIGVTVLAAVSERLLLSVAVLVKIAILDTLSVAEAVSLIALDFGAVLVTASDAGAVSEINLTTFLC